MIDFGEESDIGDFIEDDKVGGLLGFLTGEVHCPICGEGEVQWYMGTSYYWCPECKIDFFEE